ncbi:hypothetical protein [Actinomadura sp. NBRC 104412]|uniref:baeRF2 domain-containing protein n=1 Tax=Actinomadura sp. NBRC 104412 TaxID=3032203 RepID=UPI0025521CB0|nr:hypothetical protein [Actinomadura sp. NBRC 104412]
MAVRWRAVLRELAGLGVGARVRESLTRRVLGMPPGPAVLAAFIVDGEDEPTVFQMPGACRTEMVVRAALPRILPVLAWLQHQPPYVLAVVGRDGADIEIHPGGTAPMVVRTVTAPVGDGATRTRDRRGRHRHPGQDGWERTGSCVADVLKDQLVGGRTRLLLLAGDPRALHAVDQGLPGSMRHQVSVRYVPGGRGQDGTWHRGGLNVQQQLRAWVDEQNRRVLRRIGEGRDANGWVAEGASATLEALAHGRVRVLVVVNDAEDRRTAWFVPGGAEASMTLPATGSAGLHRRAALADVAVRAAILTGAEIRIVEPDTVDAPAEGIGALCRFGG